VFEINNCMWLSYYWSGYCYWINGII